MYYSLYTGIPHVYLVNITLNLTKGSAPEKSVIWIQVQKDVRLVEILSSRIWEKEQQLLPVNNCLFYTL